MVPCLPRDHRSESYSLNVFDLGYCESSQSNGTCVHFMQRPRSREARLFGSCKTKVFDINNLLSALVL